LLVLLLLLLVSHLFNPYLDSSLAFIGLKRDDLSLRNDYTSRDPYRFAIVDSLLQRPLESVDFLLTFNHNFWENPLENSLRELGPLYGFDLQTRDADFLDCLHHCSEQISDALVNKQHDIDQAFERLIVFAPEPTGSIEEEKAYEEEYYSLVNMLHEYGHEISYEDIFSAALTMLRALEYFSLAEFQLGTSVETVSGVSGEILYYGDFNFGKIIVGDSGPNVYEDDFAVIIDVGGDDTYYCSGQKRHIRIVRDESGDDTYLGDDYSLACGRFGVSILIDINGDDTYEGQSFSIGVGVFGVGILIDRAGNDRYRGDTFTQGAGGFGIGILRDENGNDIYEGALYAQGVGSTYGIGILGDGNGNDLYVTRKKYLDEIRYLDHYVSMSQGFSIGFRPDLSAGIGILLEEEGNDCYSCDVFGQGASYWYGIGAIVEAGGNDDYVAYQYTQGSGVHIALGLLIDESGDDNYVAKGVSQGCGHDLALGLLYDRHGDDTYAAYDLSQGAGNANGIGLLVDEEGADTYAVKRLNNTQGYGNFRREYGSIGVLIDLLGSDFHASGVDASFWLKGEYGIGVDWQ
jgi:hypothetical protein